MKKILLIVLGIAVLVPAGVYAVSIYGSDPCDDGYAIHVNGPCSGDVNDIDASDRRSDGVSQPIAYAPTPHMPSGNRISFSQVQSLCAEVGRQNISPSASIDIDTLVRAFAERD